MKKNNEFKKIEINNFFKLCYRTVKELKKRLLSYFTSQPSLTLDVNLNMHQKIYIFDQFMFDCAVKKLKYSNIIALQNSRKAFLTP